MIKRYAPYFNIMLRDDKHYPYIRIDFNEKFPRVCVTRKVENDGAKYYGPYIAAHILHDLLDKTPLPIESDPVTIYMIWHERSTNDPAHIWVRNRIQNIAGEISEKMTKLQAT